MLICTSMWMHTLECILKHKTPLTRPPLPMHSPVQMHAQRAYYDRTGYESTTAAAAAQAQRQSARPSNPFGAPGGPGMYYQDDFDPTEIFNMFFGWALGSVLRAWGAVHGVGRECGRVRPSHSVSGPAPLNLSASVSMFLFLTLSHTHIHTHTHMHACMHACMYARRNGMQGNVFRSQFGGGPRRHAPHHAPPQQQQRSSAQGSARQAPQPDRHPGQSAMLGLLQFLPVLLLIMVTLFSGGCVGGGRGGEAGSTRCEGER
jgi:hypothetical protein